MRPEHNEAMLNWNRLVTTYSIYPAISSSFIYPTSTTLSNLSLVTSSKQKDTFQTIDPNITIDCQRFSQHARASKGSRSSEGAVCRHSPTYIFTHASLPIFSKRASMKFRQIEFFLLSLSQIRVQCQRGEARERQIRSRRDSVS